MVETNPLILFAGYCELAPRTLKLTGNKDVDLLHMVCGMTSELRELDDANNDSMDLVNISEEYIDILWYVASYIHLRSLNPLECIEILHLPQMKFINAISDMNDLVKKYVIYGKGIYPPDEKDYLSNIVSYVVMILKRYNIDFGQSLQNNIDKLKVRYPDKYSDVNAQIRDLDAERKELEK